MDKPLAWVSFHADGAWSVTCPSDDLDPASADDAVVGWTSL